MKGATAVGAIFEPVQPLTTFEETVDRLGTAIRLGLLEPGARLPAERDLAEQLGISRSTLRQALTTLVQSGHLVSLRGRSGGTFVSEDPPLRGKGRLRQDWRECLDQRVAIECGAALLAAERQANPAALAAMEEAIGQMEHPVTDFEVYRRADVRFHIGLAEATGIAQMTEVQGEMSEIIGLIAHPDMVLAHSNDEHRKIVACVRKGDGFSAVKVLRAHLAGTEHIVGGLLPATAA
jgi:GntR family transcriptional repressor for pyruvate dehydrogenase complex